MTTKSLAQQVEALEMRQKDNWPLACSNYAALDNAQVRDLPLGESLVVLEYNPERRRSAEAPVDAAALAARPCFLCRSGQPAEQEMVEWGSGRYKIQVNPYPIFPRHLTISATEHVAQSLYDPRRVGDMFALARELQDYVIFYNGPRCGASAPHHFHYQAGMKGIMPLCDEVMNELAWPDENRIEGNDEGFIAYSQRFGRFLFMIKSEQQVQAELYFARLQVAMMMSSGLMDEPMQNLLCWVADGEYYLVVVPRRKHRPDCYGRGEGKMLLSPASTEMGGLWVVAVKEDYDSLTAPVLQKLYDELCIDNATAVSIIDNYFKAKSL